MDQIGLDCFQAAWRCLIFAGIYRNYSIVTVWNIWDVDAFRDDLYSRELSINVFTSAAACFKN